MIVRTLNIFVFVAFYFAACQNPKAEIVDRQRKLKDSIGRAKKEIKFWNDLLLDNERYKRLSIEDFNKEMTIIETNENRLERYTREYDSLEFELKKY